MTISHLACEMKYTLSAVHNRIRIKYIDIWKNLCSYCVYVFLPQLLAGFFFFFGFLYYSFSIYKINFSKELK